VPCGGALLGVTAQAQELGWMPPQLIITCAGEPATCAPVAVGQEIILAIWQIQGNTTWVSGAEFGLSFTNLEPIELVAGPGFTNLGTMTSPILVGGDCSHLVYKQLLAELRVRVVDPSSVRVCFTASDNADVNCSIICGTNGTYTYHLDGGYRYGDLPNCPQVYGSGDCLTIPVESYSWGRIKSTYR
jgi:hypothetical protein